LEEFRFAVGRVGGSQSASWKLWTQGNETYLLQRGISAKHQKFSFHSSGNCRWAEINPKLRGSERAILEWTRDQVREVGHGQGCLLASVTFPTNHLSAPRGTTFGKLSWIDPAPPGRAVHVEVFLTQEGPMTIEKLFGVSGHRQLLACLKLRNGMHICAAASIVDCGPVDLMVPGKPSVSGQIFGEVSFPDKDDRNTGRPIRMVLMGGNARPPHVWELGGFETNLLPPQQPSR
jgi:hypothetical protein